MLRLALTIMLSLGLANAELLPGWGASNPDSDQVLDHSDWQTLITQFVTKDELGQTYFAYADVNTDDRALLQSYVRSLEQVNPLALNPAEEKAYWINLYNALTVDVILENYPVESIRNIGGAFGGFIPTGPWDLEVTTINGQALSLNNIEHDIVRPKYDDFRVHFGFNCAALGCPNLSEQAFTGDNIEALLDQANETFVNHPRGLRFEDSRLVLSKIYDWYLQDFVDDEDELPRFLSEFAAPTLRDLLRNYTGRIRYEYDWTLNEETPSQ